uniref:Uncharacterized protein n=1 Tax=Pseudopediastrum sp. CL0201VA TaxID=2184484 RepID=A0A2U8GJP3_9CHLO|nr:hypothetical protein [Pseudopediastrum sp. CL0201VA]AWI68917.1 hypothetical protein [Pseudopediastrum sp. CL0201VA]
MSIKYDFLMKLIVVGKAKEKSNLLGFFVSFVNLLRFASSVWHSQTEGGGAEGGGAEGGEAMRSEGSSHLFFASPSAPPKTQSDISFFWNHKMIPNSLSSSFANLRIGNRRLSSSFGNLRIGNL